MQKENISINLPNFAFLVTRNCQNNKIITKIDIFMTLKNPYVHLVPQCDFSVRSALFRIETLRVEFQDLSRKDQEPSLPKSCDLCKIVLMYRGIWQKVHLRENKGFELKNLYFQCSVRDPKEIAFRGVVIPILEGVEKQ